MQKPIPRRRSAGYEDIPGAHPEPERLTLHRDPKRMTIHVSTNNAGRETYCYAHNDGKPGVMLYTERRKKRLSGAQWDALRAHMSKRLLTTIESLHLRYAREGKLEGLAEQRGSAAVTLALRHIRHEHVIDALEDKVREEYVVSDEGPYERGTATQIARGAEVAA